MNSLSDLAKGSILIVDDMHANLHLLTNILTQAGYTVRPVPDGKLALNSIKIALPDLILLDIMMPSLNGYEVCELLKEDESTRDIPIIFISALQEISDKVKAFKLGGVDFITKPFHTEEVLARVSTHMTLHNLRRVLKQQNTQLQTEVQERKHTEEALQQLNAELEQRVAERTAELQQANSDLQKALESLQKNQEQLIQSERMRLLVSLVAGVAHEINTPVGLGLTAATHLEMISQDFDARYAQGAIKRSELETYLQRVSEATRAIVQNMQTAAQRTQSFKEIAVDQASGEKREFNLRTYLDEILLNLRPKLKRTAHQIQISCPEDLTLYSFPGAFSQIFSNLIMNSLIHGFKEKPQGEIHIDIQLQNESLLLYYYDNGKGMTREQCSRVFEAFFTTKREQGGSGLGMNIVYNLVTKKLKGSIDCESLPDIRTTFTIQIPLHET